jgi:D-alanine-D-alanine ligase
MLIEEFVDGREFTVGILGNGNDTKVFEPMEICYLREERENRVYSYTVKKNYKKYVEYSCPPLLDAAATAKMKETALEIYKALDCRDFSRIDFRLSRSGIVYFIEINPLPGLAPGYSDYPMLAEFCGTDYRTLVLSVLNSALGRYGMKEISMK